MRLILLKIIIVLGTVQPTFSQENTLQDTTYLSKDVDKSPAPEKGLDGLYKQFYKYFRYPADARRYGIEGIVNLSFTIDKEGQVSEIMVVNGIGYGSEDAVLEAFKQVRVKWIPGLKNSEKVKVRIILPFRLKLA